MKKGDKELLDWLNQDLEKLAKEGVIHQAYEKTLKPVYGDTINQKIYWLNNSNKRGL